MALAHLVHSKILHITEWRPLCQVTGGGVAERVARGACEPRGQGGHAAGEQRLRGARLLGTAAQRTQPRAAPLRGRRAVS